MEDFSKQELDELQSWLDGLKLNEIPEPSEWDRSLMDIMGIKHHENMWSDIYKFFFTPSEEHKMDDLFITSLEQLTGINPFLSDYNYNVEREYGNRIDLVLYNKNKRLAIIIENKVNHILNNDLNNYQSSIKKFLGSPCTIKTVVLGLHHYDLDKYEKASEISKEDKFSITHKELLDKVFENIPNYLKDAQIKYVYLLKDFYKNICNMTNNLLDPNVLDFFCQSSNKPFISNINRVYEHIEKFISDIMKCSVDSQLKSNLKEMEIDWKPERGYVKYVIPDTNELMLTVFFRDTILSHKEPHVFMVLELQKEYKEKYEKNRDVVNSIVINYSSEDEDGIKLGDKSDEKKNEWIHLATQTIPLKNLKEDLPMLGKIMGKYINRSSSIIRMAYEIIKELSIHE